MRRRFRYDKVSGEMVEITNGDIQPARDRQDLLWNDRGYEGLKATDGADISSRSKHREYMRRNGLTTIDDFTEVNKKNEAKRADYYQGKPGTGAVRKEDIARAIDQLERGRRR